MPTTPRGIWTPGDNDGWDLVVDLAATANSVDSAIDAAVGGFASQISKVGTTIAALGAGDRAGQVGWVTDAGAYVIWNGAAWIAPRGQRVANATARAALYPTPSNGDMVYRTDLSSETYYVASSPAGWVRDVTQSGYVTPPNPGTATVTFPIPFRTTPVLNTWVYAGSNVTVPYVRYSNLLVGFTVSAWTVGGGQVAAHNVAWDATGQVAA